MTKRWLLSGLILILSSGCSMIKDTKDMKAKTQELADKEQVISDNEEYLRTDLSTKESTDKVGQFLDLLFAVGPEGIPTGKTLEGDMLADGKGTVLAMRFQLWKAEYGDKNISMLDSMFALQINYIMNRCATLIPRDFNIDVLSPDGYYKAMGSLAAFLGEETDGYKDVLTAHGLKNLSLYDVFVAALRQRGRVDRQEQLPKATDAVLLFQREALYLLQLRQNYIPMIILGRMPVLDPFSHGLTSIAAMPDLERFGIRLTGLQAFMDFGNVNDSNSVGVAELKEWTKGLNDVLQTRQDLRDMGIMPVYNHTFLGILQKVDLGQTQIQNVSVESLSPEQKVMRTFADTWNVVIHPKDDAQLTTPQ